MVIVVPACLGVGAQSLSTLPKVLSHTPGVGCSRKGNASRLSDPVSKETAMAQLRPLAYSWDQPVKAFPPIPPEFILRDVLNLF